MSYKVTAYNMVTGKDRTTTYKRKKTQNDDLDNLRKMAKWNGYNVSKMDLDDTHHYRIWLEKAGPET